MMIGIMNFQLAQDKKFSSVLRTNLAVGNVCNGLSTPVRKQSFAKRGESSVLIGFGSSLAEKLVAPQSLLFTLVFSTKRRL
jgi:hypothetical protein